MLLLNIKSNDRAEIMKLHVVAAHGPCTCVCCFSATRSSTRSAASITAARADASTAM